MNCRYFLNTFILILGLTASSSAVHAAGSVTQTLKLKAERQKNNKYITLNGNIPDICKEKVALNFSCKNPNTVVYKLREVTEDGFKCLQDYQSRCSEGAVKKECISLEKLSKNKALKENFIIRFDKKTDEGSCKDVSISVATVEIIRQKYNAEKATTEAGACVDCMIAEGKSNRDSFGPEKQIQNLKKIVMEDFNEKEEPEERPRPQRKARSSERPQMSPSGNMGGMGSNGSTANYATLLSSALSSLMYMNMYSNRSNYYQSGYGYSPYMNSYSAYSSYPYSNMGYSNYSLTGYSYPYSAYSNYSSAYTNPYSVYGTSNYYNSSTNYTLPTTYNATTYGGR